LASATGPPPSPRRSTAACSPADHEPAFARSVARSKSLGTGRSHRYTPLQITGRAAARDGAVRDYRSWLQTTARRKPATINTILAALANFYTRAGLGPPNTKRLDLPQRAPCARRGLITVRAGKGGRYRAIPVHAGLREHLAVWISNERAGWPGAGTSPALLLNRRGGRLSARGAHDILLAT
jgi:hypothetical protein